eukprot:9449872-Lingulodinium_polyedra.AAC.1
MQRMGAVPVQRLQSVSQSVSQRPMLSHEGEALIQGNEDHVHMSGRAWVDHMSKAQHARSQSGVGAKLKQGVSKGCATVQGEFWCRWPCPFPRPRRSR